MYCKEVQTMHSEYKHSKKLTQNLKKKYCSCAAPKRINKGHKRNISPLEPSKKGYPFDKHFEINCSQKCNATLILG